MKTGIFNLYTGLEQKSKADFFCRKGAAHFGRAEQRIDSLRTKRAFSHSSQPQIKALKRMADDATAFFPVKNEILFSCGENRNYRILS